VLNDNGNYIVFVIKDNGVGFEMFSKNIKDILNPYFTTKKKGTGLGLAIVNKIINDHHGSVTFKPLINGAEIQIYFKK
jgi:two-component system nitrogen regulation sensor histidine kinase NtrY